MKHHAIKVVALFLLLSVILTACGSASPAPSDPQETESTVSTTKTTTTTESTTTTTTAETTLTTAKPTESKTAATSKITKTNSTTTTTETSTDGDPTYPKGHPYYQANPPFEDKSSAPGKDKQRLLFNVGGEEVEFTFDKAMRYPEYYDELLWHYSGTTKDGVPFTCKVAAEHNQIFEVDCDVNGDFIVIEEEDARACMKRFLKEHNLPQSADEITLNKSAITMQGTPERPATRIVNWSFALPLEKEGDYFCAIIHSRNGKTYVSHIESGRRETVEGQIVSLPYCLGDGASLMTPRWKSK